MECKLLFKLLVILSSIGWCISRKNVLFLVSDDMRPELGAYEGPNFPSPVHPNMYTPNLDALAAKSLLLKRAYTQQALCSPSRTALLTGRRPDTTHVYDLFTYFRNVGGNFTTLPEYFKQNGYRSIGIGKIFHPGPGSGFDDPDSWSEPYFHGVANFESRQRSWLAVPDVLLKDNPLIDRQIADQAISTLRRVALTAKSGEENFFVAVGFHKPHLPFVFPESFMQKYYPLSSIQLPQHPHPPVNMPSIAWFTYGGLREFSDIVALNVTGDINTTLPDRAVLELRRAYYSAVSYIDSLVGRVITELDNLGLANSTIISFFGDHGWQLGEHGEWCKQTNFEIATHAPMMIHVPGLTDAGVETRQLTEFVDLFPTLVEAAGLPSLTLCPENSAHTNVCHEGTSLLPLILNPNRAIKRAAFSQHPRGPNVMGYTLRTDQYRYTEWAEFQYTPVYKPDWNKLVGVELYDHLADPDENYNGAYDSKYQDVRMTLSPLLHAGWRNSVVNHDDNVLVG